MTENELTQPTIHSPERQERLRADYKFVFAYHTEEFADEISRAVQDCDTVALEYVGFQSDEERQAWNEKLTSYISGNATEQQRAEVQDELTRSAGGAYLGTVLEKLQGSDKKIVLLDIDEDNPNYSLVTDYWTANRNYYKAVSDGSSVEEVKQAGLAFVQAGVDSFGVRESTMADQLKALGLVPGKVGVITGVIHTPIMEELSGVADTSSMVIGPESKIVDGTQSTDYDDLDVVIQQTRLNGIENIDIGLLHRAVLKDIIASYDIDFGENEVRNLVNTLDIEQVEGLLDKVDTIRATSPQYSKGFLRMVMAKNEMVEALQAVWPTIPDNPKVTVRKVQ